MTVAFPIASSFLTEEMASEVSNPQRPFLNLCKKVFVDFIYNYLAHTNTKLRDFVH